MTNLANVKPIQRYDVFVNESGSISWRQADGGKWVEYISHSLYVESVIKIDPDRLSVIDVWVVMTNTDLTEGRGAEFVYKVCEIEATAHRFSKKMGVQGSDGTIRKTIAIKHGRAVFVPGRIEPPSQADKEAQSDLERRAKILEKMREAGISEADMQFVVIGR